MQRSTTERVDGVFSVSVGIKVQAHLPAKGGQLEEGLVPVLWALDFLVVYLSGVISYM